MKDAPPTSAFITSPTYGKTIILPNFKEFISRGGINPIPDTDLCKRGTISH